jgi:uncharacterized membrane protein YphA (DoxX/SURF4 family)
MSRLTKALGIALRIAIGWHFLYEGVFKLGLDEAWKKPTVTRYSPQAGGGKAPEAGRPGGSLVQDESFALAAWRAGSERFTTEPFRRSRWGPLRPVYRILGAETGDLERLSPDYAARSLDQHYGELVEQYRLNPAQCSRLGETRDALKRESARLLGTDEIRARRQQYRQLLDAARAAEQWAWSPNARERAQLLRQRAEATGAELASYVTQASDELTLQAVQLATVEQLKTGQPLTRAWDGHWMDLAISWTLVLVGLCLISGFRLTAAAWVAAGLLAAFYLAAPPWPGFPVPPGEGHYLFVDRNLIEMLAVLVVAKGAER